MKSLIMALALIVAVPAAHAQVIIQAPGVPGLARVEPDRPGEYWRRPPDGDHDNEWRRREEYREEARRAEWQRDHCVRDYRNQVFCRR